MNCKPFGTVLCAALIAAGCAPRNGASPSGAPPASYIVSHDGSIHYRMPAGWFDAGGDSLTPESRLWLMRGDYAGSLTVRQVHVQAMDAGDDEGTGSFISTNVTGSSTIATNSTNR